MSKQVTTPKFRVSFVNLFEPTTFDGKTTFNAELIFPADADLSGMKAAAAFAVQDKWKGNTPQPLSNPFKSGTELNDQRVAAGKKRLPGYDGCTFVRVKSFDKPRVVDEHVKEVPALESGKVYAGSYGFAQLGASAWSHQTGGNGVSFYLNMYQFAADGERLDARQDPNDVFTQQGGAGNPAAPADNGTGAGGMFD